MTLLLILISLAAFVGFGALAVAYGADSRLSDTRDTRPSWY